MNADEFAWELREILQRYDGEIVTRKVSEAIQREVTALAEAYSDAKATDIATSLSGMGEP